MRASFNLPDEVMFGRETSNMRIFETTKAGALLLAEDCSNLGDYFEIGKDIQTFSSMSDFIEKLGYFIDPRNENYRKQIANSGFNRSTISHSIESRAIWFENILFTTFDI
jgi:spore maturation protein CgeB